MTSLYENASDAGERPRGLYLVNKPDEKTTVPSRSSDVVYQIAAMAAALILLATMV